LHNQAIILFYALLVLSVSAALWKGGAPERTGAAIVIGTLALEWVGRAVVPPNFNSIYPVAVIIDAVATASFGALSLYARRAWPIWATALQLLSLTSHFAQGIEPSHPGIYLTMKSGPTLMVLLVLLLGTGFHRRRLRRHGRDLAWMGW
jgi:hypothetical protein